MIYAIEKNPSDDHFNKICEKGFKEYKGKQHCVYNIAKAMAETKQYLVTEVSKKEENWNWGNIHVNEYSNAPWSLTVFKPLFHREVSVAGNGNTINVSKYNLKKTVDSKKFKSTHTPSYRQLIHLTGSEYSVKSGFSHEGGQSGNLFSGHYFDFN